VGDRLVIYYPKSRYSPEYFTPIVVTKVGRKWFYYRVESLTRSSRTDRYAAIERGPNEGLAFTDGGDFSQHSYQVCGFLDWEERALRRWVDLVISEAGLQWRNYSTPEFEKRLELARFLVNSDLFETPEFPVV
jgi:hypothetical protein